MVPDSSLTKPTKDDQMSNPIYESEPKIADLTNFTKVFDGIQEQLLRTKDKLHETEMKNNELQGKNENLICQVGCLPKFSIVSDKIKFIDFSAERRKIDT